MVSGRAVPSGGAERCAERGSDAVKRGSLRHGWSEPRARAQHGADPRARRSGSTSRPEHLKRRDEGGHPIGNSDARAVLDTEHMPARTDDAPYWARTDDAVAMDFSLDSSAVDRALSRDQGWTNETGGRGRSGGKRR